jgi:polysaccharide deacetylase family protein (PEP-CTERM system associated)
METLQSSGMVEAALPSSMRGTITVSIDVEDWHQLVTRRMSGSLSECSQHVETQIQRVLDTLDERGIQGTFFVLGLVAREKPHLVKSIAARGHEVASHGIQHLPLHRLDRNAVRADLRDSRALLSDIVGQDVVGFRAPEFSIMEDNRWALEEVAAAGYRYDSSIYPIAHRRYGIRSFPRGPVRLSFGDQQLWELPLGTLRTKLGNVPIGGGGYFRLLPGRVLERVIRSLTGDGENVMLYFHPYEFAATRLALERDAMPTETPARLRAEVWLALQAIGRSRLPGRARRAIGVARAVRAIDLVNDLDGAPRAAASIPTESFESSVSTSRRTNNVRN